MGEASTLILWDTANTAQVTITEMGAGMLITLTQDEGKRIRIIKLWSDNTWEEIRCD